MTDYPRLINNLTRRINYGTGGDYEELCRLRCEYASTFAPTRPGVFDIPRTALRLLKVEDFPVGSMVRCGKYLIWCKGRHTTVSTKDSFADLQMRHWPMYIKEFI